MAIEAHERRRLIPAAVLLAVSAVGGWMMRSYGGKQAARLGVRQGRG